MSTLYLEVSNLYYITHAYTYLGAIIIVLIPTIYSFFLLYNTNKSFNFDQTVSSGSSEPPSVELMQQDLGSILPEVSMINVIK